VTTVTNRDSHGVTVMTDHDTVTRAYRRDGVTVMSRVKKTVRHTPTVTGQPCTWFGTRAELARITHFDVAPGGGLMTTAVISNCGRAESERLTQALITIASDGLRPHCSDVGTSEDGSDRSEGVICV
jgi:hypothetical protein